MHRRRFCRHTLHALCALSTVPLLAACMGGDPFISLARLQEALQGQFPRPVALLPGLELQLLQPTLRTLPEANRLGAHMPLQASGSLLGAPREGLVELDFGLRFMPQDGTLRAHELRVQRLELAGLPPAVATLLQGAQIAIETPPGQAWCLGCGQTVAIARRGDACPQCGGFQLQPTGGQELRVLDMMVGDD